MSRSKGVLSMGAAPADRPELRFGLRMAGTLGKGRKDGHGLRPGLSRLKTRAAYP